ncbi:unnamed protein product [Aphanomyces euteiches]|uniref:Sphingomyelin synthase-like domain-containing protein n=1 Tax=Aphanomyces euteiches TaxID=100861 RepID=A0A6G0XV02_9STRA|nr:hypothetical protein Ae201684_000966 [Aphanomyces euteiches]KAH9099553.1 hypothetical protein Ae201684P_018566 [Aphanomyces euteiches]KAH9152758.1 hypothetical protein AeRB84_004878 [Aphanomyces euteiches]
MSPLNYIEKLCLLTDVAAPSKHVKEQRQPRVDPVDLAFVPTKHQEYEQGSMVHAWQTKWNRSLASKVDIIGSVCALVWSLQIYQNFLRWNETRTDIHGFALLHDPVLRQLTPHDFSLPLFFLVYGAVILALVYGRNKPDFVMEFLQAKTCVVWMRMVALFLVPLEVPADTIPLIDPIAGGDGVVLMRDLFFSGHTATTFLAFLTCRRQDWSWKLFFLCMALTTAAMVTLQKTHYAIDVFAAPFFVYTCHGVVYELRSQYNALYMAP